MPYSQTYRYTKPAKEYLTHSPSERTKSYRKLRKSSSRALGCANGFRQPSEAWPPLQDTTHPAAQAFPESQPAFIVRDPGPLH